MSDPEGFETLLFTKSSKEAIGVGLNEWQGKIRVDIRTYVQAIGENGLLPTKKGISLPIEHYPQLLEAIRQLGDVMSAEKTVACIRKSTREEVRIGITKFKGIPLIYLRTFANYGSESTELKPTKKGVSIRVDLYPKLLEAVEALGQEVSNLTG